MYNFAVGGVQFDRRGCSTSVARLFNLSVSTVQFETVRVFNAGEIFKRQEQIERNGAKQRGGNVE